MLDVEANSVANPKEREKALPMEVVDRLSQERAPSRSASTRFVPAIVAALLCVMALLFATGDSNAWFRRAPASQPELGPTLRQSVFGLGRLEPEGEVISVAAPGGASESRVEQLLVHEGARVRQGEVLAVLDNRERLEAARLVAAETVEQSRARLSQTLLEVETTKDRLEAAVSSAEAQLETAKSKLARSQLLLAARATSKESFDDRELGVTTAEAALREAKSRLARYQPDGDHELADIAVARHDLAVAKASLRQAQANLSQSTVLAPVDGTILDVRGRIGERIGQSPLLDMGKTDHMMALVEVYESDVPEVYVGQSAKLFASPFAGSLSGKVDRISNLVRKQKIIDADPAANTDARVVEVRVRLDPDSSKLAAKFVNLQVQAELLR